MRAKVVLRKVTKHETCEQLVFNAVCKQDGPYPPDGSDENNTFARYSPSAEFTILVNNPALQGKFEPGEAYYVDFTPTAL